MGVITTLHPRLVDMIGIDSTSYSVVVAELDVLLLNQLISKEHAEPVTLQDQLIRREVSFVVPKQMPYGLITDALQQLPEIKQCELFDIYQ